MAIEFSADSLSVLLVDPKSSSIATSILFDHALSISKSNGCSTIVRAERLAAIPPRLFDLVDYRVSQLRKIEFVYLSDRDQFVTYLAKVYDCLGVPATLVVECLETYASSRPVALASLLALAHDLGLWMKEKRKIDDSGRPSSPVVCSIVADRSEHAKMVELIARYTKFVWILRADDEDVHSFHRFGEETRVKLKVEDQEIVRRV